VARLNAAARELIASGPLAHLVTINRDGSPQLSVIWVGLDGDELVSGHHIAVTKIGGIGHWAELEG